MSSPHWPVARDRMAYLLGGNDPAGVRRAAAKLDEWCAALRAGQVPRELVWRQWQEHLKAVADSDPYGAGALSALVTDGKGPREGRDGRAAGSVPQPARRRRRGWGIGTWIGIAAVPVVLAAVAFVIVGLMSSGNGSTYGVGDCVILEWRSIDSGNDAFVAIGKTSCGANVRGDGTYQVNRVVSHPGPNDSEYCDVEAAGGGESSFREDATDTLYCVVD